MAKKPALDGTTQLDLHEMIRLVRGVCYMAGAASLIDDSRVGLARSGVIRAVQRHDTPVIFGWLIEMLSYQGVSDSIAHGYMEQHGRVHWHDIAEALSHLPSCGKLRCYWAFEGAATARVPACAPARSTSRNAPCRGTICATGG